MRTAWVAIFAMSIVLIAAQPATAALVQVNFQPWAENSLSYDAVPGETNSVQITLTGGTFTVTDTTATLTPGLDCMAQGMDMHTVTCTDLEVAEIDVQLGDGNDTLTVNAATVSRVYGGMGADRITGGPGSDFLDGEGDPPGTPGVAGSDFIDGGAGNDQITDSTTNTAEADTLLGGVGNDTLSAYGGNDSLDGGSGNDSLAGGSGKDAYSGGEGADRFSARDGVAETLACGGGVDVGQADRADLRTGCEQVEVPDPPKPNPPKPDVSVTLTAKAAKSQRVLRQTGFVVTGTCPAERCRLTASGSVSVPQVGAAARLKLKSASRTVVGGKSTRLTLRLSTTGKKKLRRVLRTRRGRKHSVAKIALTATDTAGNTKTKRLSIRIKA